MRIVEVQILGTRTYHYDSTLMSAHQVLGAVSSSLDKLLKEARLRKGSIPSEGRITVDFSSSWAGLHQVLGGAGKKGLECDAEIRSARASLLLLTLGHGQG